MTKQQQQSPREVTDNENSPISDSDIKVLKSLMSQQIGKKGKKLNQR